ncbi:Highly reducing polyketide synthase gloL [Colletotrichum sp. SAR 10_86]|nr:Highly reducing polyketide synthase gloL [Colletotrichum sp. SAR 10_86]
MGVRLPGHVHTPADYWDLLFNGRSGRCRVPKSRYNVEAWYGPGRPNHVPTEFGYFLEELNLAHVDPSFWSFTKQEAERMDPRQRLFLEVAYEALQSSGTTKFRGTDVGVYVGTMGDDWSQLESRDEQSLEQVRPDVYGDYILANRASYEFDLTGPSSQSHERLMRRGHRIAGITDLSKTAMVECHGTGTSVGDPIEVGAVANIWGDHGIYIGSVKPNIGHGEGASGLSSIIKMVLALENSTIPPNINFKTPNTANLLLAPKEQSRLAEAEFSQPCLVAIQVALVDLLRSWGVTPDAVVGHSSGETAAAYASGAITAEDAIRIAYHRGQITLLIKAAHKGSMAAVGLGRSQVQKFLRPGVMIGFLFSTAVESVLDDFKSAAFVEMGPHSALAGPIRQILHSKGRVAQYVPTLVRNEDAVSCVLKTAGELWSVGASIELAAVTPAGNFLTDIPTYPWHYDKEYWVESRLSRSWRLRKFDHHELLGTRVEEISDACPAWRCNLRVEDVPWIRDHMILGENIFPAAGFVSMIGEALKQLKGSVNYTLGHVTFDSALVLNDRPVELVTVLNPPPPTPYLDSEWYEFSISSLSEGGDTWVRHVTGECKAGSDSGHQAPEVVKLPRKVSLDSFYSTWKRFGLEYGARFRNLADASSHVTEPTAIASLQTELSDYEMASYAIHPTALDSSMHFAMVASCRGLTKNFKQMAIPTYIEELYVSRPSGKIHLEATATENSSMKLSSYITGVSDGETVIDIRGLEVEPVAGSSAIQAEDTHAGAIVEWKPDIDFLDPTHIVRVQDLDSCDKSLEKLVLACIVESRAQLQFLPATQPHFVDFKSWLDATYRQTVAGEHHDLASAFDIANTTPQLRQALIADMLEACKGTPTESLALAVHRVYTNAAACFTGRPDAIKAIDSAISMAEDVETLSDIDLASFLQLSGHKRPNMNILQIGGLNDTAATINKIFSAATLLGEYSRMTIARPFSDHWKTDRISIICEDPAHHLVKEATEALRRLGVNLDFVVLGEELPWGRPVVSLMDLEGSSIHGMSPQGWEDLKKTILSAQDEKVLASLEVTWIQSRTMVLQDINITDMTFEQWQTAVDPKVQGTWNLHNALQQHQSEPLDFFFLFSSLSGLGGQIGQANYAAGNAFLDAFVQYRHSKGLACSVLDIGIMEDIGVLAREQNRLEALRATKQHCLHEQDLLDALELMIRRSQPVSEEEICAIQNVNGFSSRVAILNTTLFISFISTSFHRLHTFDHKMQFNAILLTLGLLSATASAETILGCWNGRFTCAGACINKGECKEIQSSDNAWCCVV